MLLRSFSQQTELKTQLATAALKNGYARLIRANPNIVNKLGATVLYECVRHLEKSAVAFMLRWNREQERSCLSLFETNVPNSQEAMRTPLHLACSFPSLSLIAELIVDKRTRALVMDARLKLPSELVPENYLSSWKIVHKFEMSAFLGQLRSPLFTNSATDLQATDEQPGARRAGASSEHSGFDFDDAGSSGPSSCSKYASTKKRKFLLDLATSKGVGQQKHLLLQPQTQAPHNSPKIEFKNLSNSRLGLVKVAGIQNGFSQQPAAAAFKKTFVPPQPRRPSTELSLEDLMGQIAETKQPSSGRVRAIKFSIKGPKVFKTNLDISGRRSLGPPSVFSDVSENVLDLSTANKSNVHKTLTNLISTSRISESGMRKIQAKNPASSVVVFHKSSATKKKRSLAGLPGRPAEGLIERALLETIRVAKKLLSAAKLGLLRSTLSETHVRDLGRQAKIIELVFLLSSSDARELFESDKVPLWQVLRDCLGLLKELIASFATEGAAEILIFKHGYLQLVREFSAVTALHSLLAQELSELFLGLKKRVNRLQDAASKSRVASPELLLEAAVEVIAVQAKMNMSPSGATHALGESLSFLHQISKPRDQQRRRTNPLRQNLAFPNSFFQRQQRDASSDGPGNKAPDQSEQPAHGSLQDPQPQANISSAGWS